MPAFITTDRPGWFAATNGANTLAAGEQGPNAITHTGEMNSIVGDTSEMRFLGKVAGKAGNYKPLPAAGTPLQAGEIYGWNGGLVLIRQNHVRSGDNPADIQSLMTVYRENAGDVLEWVKGELLPVGALRTYGGKTWEAHSLVGENLWPPDTAPSLWREYVEVPDGPPAWVRPTGAHDAYKKGDRVTHQEAVWESTLDANVWEPGVVAGLWVKV